MRVFVALSLLAMFLPVGGCARKSQATYVELSAEAPPHTSEAEFASMGANGSAEFWSPVSDSPRGPTEAHWTTEVVSGAVEETEVMFASIQAKAERVGVEHLTQADIEGLSYDQIQELRGY